MKLVQFLIHPDYKKIMTAAMTKEADNHSRARIVTGQLDHYLSDGKYRGDTWLGVDERLPELNEVLLGMDIPKLEELTNHRKNSSGEVIEGDPQWKLDLVNLHQFVVRERKTENMSRTTTGHGGGSKKKKKNKKTRRRPKSKRR